MDTIGRSKPPQPPAASAAGGNVAVTAQILEAGTTQKDNVAETFEVHEDGKNSVKKSGDSNMKNYFRVFTYGTKFDFFLILLCCLTSIGSGITMPLMNIVFGQLVGTFTDYFIPGTTVTQGEFQAEINRLALFIFYLFIAKFVLSYLSLISIRISGLRMSAALRVAYLRALFAQPVSIIDTISPGKVSTRITTSSNTIQLAISQHFAMLFQSLSFVIGLYVVAFIKAWLLTLVASASLPFIVICYSLIIGPFFKVHKVTEKIHTEASAVAFEIFSSIRVVTAFGAEAKLGEQHEKLLDKAANNERAAAPLMGLMIAPSMVAMYGTFAISFWFGIKQYTNGKIGSVGDIAVVLFSVMAAVQSIGRVAGPIVAIAKAALAAGELFETIDAPIPDTSGFKEPEITAEADIHFDNVAFSYPSRPDIPILTGLDLHFEAGKVTAIVGPSGSGKSTIVGLVQRWYELHGTTSAPTVNKSADPSLADKKVEEEAVPKKSKWYRKRNAPAKDDGTKIDKSADDEKVQDEVKKLGPNTCTGTVRVGNTDLREVDLKWWRSKIGLVQQEPFLFNDTLYNNIIYGLCGTEHENLPKIEKMKMVEEACREAYADEFISKLPEGYETRVGESGIKLSGGQRQRIAIARSIIKQPPILILDEATSAIDVRTERIVQQALDRVSKNRTSIVIAHRLSTIRRADKIMVLRKGKLIEQGTHDELLAIEAGVYHGLVAAQNLAVEAEDEDLEDAALKKSTTPNSEKDEINDQASYTSNEDPDYKPVGLFNSFGRLMYEQRHHWLLYIIAIFGILGAGALYPIQAYVFAYMMQVFTFTGDRLVKEGNFWAGMFGVMAASVGFFYFVLGFASHLISVAVTRHYRQEYLDNMIRKRISFFDDQGHSPGSLTSRLSADCTQLQQLMSTEMSFAMIAFVNLVGSVIIAFVYGWKLTLVALFSALPIILAAGYFRMRIEIQFETDNAKVFENSSQFASEAVGGFRTVISLIMEDLIGDRYDTLLKGHVKQAFGAARFGTLIFAASDSAELACMALAFWYGGTLLARREYDIVGFFVVYMGTVFGAVAAGMWFSVAPNMAQATGAANRILMMRAGEKDDDESYTDMKISDEGVSVEFRNVDFTYKSRQVPVLSNLNLKVEAGQFAALVGASGCGKSTTISLLERFYDPTHGTILFNTQSITSLRPSTYRSHLALVSQEPTLYEGTIHENVALSVPSATSAAVEAACRDAQMHDFITSLPSGYATRLGPKGTSLSGGQKQRLALARALLRNPNLLLLDEATSSLDSESETLVQRAIERAAGAQRRTVIAVAHRLATIQNAHVIFVLGAGRVLEKGDHQGLLRKRGVYWQMCQAQALDR
ncbi:P-loop containing nucleoside triphosphate hydrolase protein [Ampelomyces quisqualis]|uniref:P-loop containing nucleoside triphosphate hydrolase protein n=1 Tax=Ampelomyces quisqualis TaxID=50730 RepID=A0A6A5QDS1_AMPQU|nr:P-loop containing nucleoside triphosphate hydrolase protein [Ampelomyces quisqualis]